MKTLFLSPLQPQNAGGGGWGGGGVGGVSRLRFPPGPHLRSSRFSRHPRLRQAPTRRFAKNRNLRGLGGLGKGPGPWWAGPQALGARAPSPWRPGPQAPGARHSSQRLTSCKPNFASQTHGSGSQNPRHERAFQALAGPKPLGIKNSKNAPVLIGS